jgi:hypothetical protein
MKRPLSSTAGIIGLAVGLFAGIASAETTAVGPYYATPSWDQTLPSNTRFIVLSNFNNEAVLDRETGLIWERAPGDISGDGIVDISNDTVTWAIAQTYCNKLRVANRMGWRVPTVQELLSLIDSTAPTGLPAGHPFQSQNVPGCCHWSVSTWAEVSTFGWAVVFGGTHGAFGLGKSVHSFVWCVRGGQGVEPSL